jgi:cytochrome c-type biogenesis protein CcmH
MKRGPGWIVLLFVVAGFLAVGIARDGGPQTPEERITALEKRLACPVCDGESVYESRNTGSVQIREFIRQSVEGGRLADQQIIDTIVVNYNGEELLVPTASGVEALAWALPATAFVVGATGLVLAFRRWQASARRLGHATDDDYALVERALAEPERADT